MMKFVLNTRNLSAPASVVCIQNLYNFLVSHGYEATINDWKNYDRYDVVVFMSYDPDIAKARAQNPRILVGLADPKTKNASDALAADFLMVSSVEQQDLFYKYNKNIFIYYMFPAVQGREKTHEEKKSIHVGYHGNKVHLNGMWPVITAALEQLGRSFQVELTAIYNIEQLGKWKIGLPNSDFVKTHHVQWSPEVYDRMFPLFDIGIVPNTMMTSHYDSFKRRLSPFSEIHLPDENDYVMRFKYSSNPGRIYLFGMYQIPVVSDFFPSSAQFLNHGRSGYIAHSVHGWYVALEKLAKSAALRQQMGQTLFHYCTTEVSRERTFKDFVAFVQDVQSNQSLAALTPLPPSMGISESRAKAASLHLEEYLSYHNSVVKKFKPLLARLVRSLVVSNQK